MIARIAGCSGSGSGRRQVARWAAALGAAGLIATAGPAFAEIEGPCQAFVNGVPVDQIDTPAEARDRMVLDEGDSVAYTGTSEVAVGFVAIDLVFSPLSFELFNDEVNDESRTYGGSARVGDVARYGKGIYEVRGRTAACTGNAFVVLGESGAPWGSLAGQAGAGLAALGLMAAAFGAWVPAGRGRGIRWLRCVLAALPLGLGSAVLVQQGGYYPLGAPLLGVAIAVTFLLATLVAAGISAVGRPNTGGTAAATAGPGMAAMPRPPGFSPPPRPSAPPPGVDTAASGAATTISGSDPGGVNAGAAAAPAAASAAVSSATETASDIAAPAAGPAGTAPAASTPAGSGASAVGAQVTDAGGARGTGTPPASGTGTAPPAGGEVGGAEPGASALGADVGPGGQGLPGVGAEAGSTSAPGGVGAEAGSTSVPSGVGSEIGGSAQAHPGAGPETGSSATSGAGAGTAPAAGGPLSVPGAVVTGLPVGSGIDLASLAARGVLGLATTGALAGSLVAAARRKRDGDEEDGSGPYWFSVEAPTAMYPLSGENEIVDYLPGDDWYLAVATYDQWVHAEDPERGIAGFVARYAVNPAGPGA